jgi:hypothetical protein
MNIQNNKNKNDYNPNNNNTKESNSKPNDNSNINLNKNNNIMRETNLNDLKGALIPSISSSSIKNSLKESILNTLRKYSGKEKSENENNKEIVFNVESEKKLKNNEKKEEKKVNIHGIVIEQKDNKDFEEKEEIYSTYKLLNLMSSIINDEKYEDDENYENEKTIINDDYGNLTDSFFDSKIIFNNNVNLNKNNILKKSIFGPKEKNDVEKLKNDIEKKLGKDFTDYLINYVSSESDKKSIQFNRNKIAEQLKNDFNSKKINVNRDLLNKGMELLPDIFSVIIGKRIEEENE